MLLKKEWPNASPELLRFCTWDFKLLYQPRFAFNLLTMWYCGKKDVLEYGLSTAVFVISRLCLWPNLPDTVYFCDEKA